MKMDICEHILLILAAILSDLNLQKEFEHLITPIPSDDTYSNLAENGVAAALVENLDNIELIQIPNVLTDDGDGGVGGGSGIIVDNLNGSHYNLSQCHIKENMQSVDMENIPITDDQLNCEHTNQYSDGLELVHYRVELMDQFEMQTGGTSAVQQTPGDVSGGSTIDTLGVDDIYAMDSDPSRSTDIVLSYLYPDDFSIDDLPLEIMDTFERPVSSDNLLLAPNKNGNEHEYHNLDADAYINWLSSVIETINLALDFNGDGHPQPLEFSVSHVIPNCKL